MFSPSCNFLFAECVVASCPPFKGDKPFWYDILSTNEPSLAISGCHPNHLPQTLSNESEPRFKSTTLFPMVGSLSGLPTPVFTTLLKVRGWWTTQRLECHCKMRPYNLLSDAHNIIQCSFIVPTVTFVRILWRYVHSHALVRTSFTFGIVLIVPYFMTSHFYAQW